MKTIRTAILWGVIGLLVGLWFGVNIGRGKPVYANPFQAETVREKLKRTGEDILERGGEALEETGQALKKSIKKD